MSGIAAWLKGLARWRTLIVVQLANLVSFQVLFWLESRFTALTGKPVFDTQNDLTAAAIREQLPLYAGPARDAYLWFAAYDFVFPLLASISLVMLAAVLLRLNTFGFAQRLLALGAPLLFLFPTLFDWGENVGLLAVLGTTAPSTAAIDTALVFKMLKLTSLSVSASVIGVLFVFALANWGVRLAAYARRRG
jgi:hypothetical protein